MPILVNSDDSSRPSAQQLADYLSGLGANYGERLMLTGAATSESGRDPGATHDNGIGYGMFGHNGPRLAAMQTYANSNGADISDWRTQAAFALNELRSRPEGKAAANASTPEQATLAQMYFEQPAGFTSQNPTAGRNFSGRLDTIRSLAAGDKNAPASFAASGGQTGAALSGSAGLPASAGGTGNGGMVGAMGPAAVPAYGNRQLNAALANALRGPTSDGFQPLVPYVIGKGANTLLGSLNSLLGGGAAPAASSPSAPASPLASAPSPVASPAAQSPQSASLPFFAAGPPPASSPIVQPAVGPTSAAPTMTQGFGAGLANLFGLGAQA